MLARHSATTAAAAPAPVANAAAPSATGAAAKAATDKAADAAATTPRPAPAPMPHASFAAEDDEWAARCRLCFQPTPAATLQPHPDPDIATLLTTAGADCTGGWVCKACVGEWSSWRDSPRPCSWCGHGDGDAAYACDECERRVCLTCLAASYGGAAAAAARDWHAESEHAATLPWYCPSCDRSQGFPLRRHAALADAVAIGSLSAQRTINPFALADGVRGLTYLTPRGHPLAAAARQADPDRAQWQEWQSVSGHCSPPVSVRFSEAHRAGFHNIGSATAAATAPPIEPQPAIEWEPQSQGSAALPDGRTAAAAASFAAAAASAPAAAAPAAAASSSSSSSSGRLLRLVSTSLFRYAPGMGVHDSKDGPNPLLKYFWGLMAQVDEFPRIFPFDEGWRLRIYYDDSLSVPCGCQECHFERPNTGQSVRFELPEAWAQLRDYLSTLPFVQLVYWNWPHVKSQEKKVVGDSDGGSEGESEGESGGDSPCGAADHGGKARSGGTPTLTSTATGGHRNRNRKMANKAEAPEGTELWTHRSHHLGNAGMLVRFLALGELGHTAELVLLSDLDGVWSRRMKERLDQMMMQGAHCLRACDPDYKVELWGGASAFAFHSHSPAPLCFDWLEAAVHAFACWHLRHPDELWRLRAIRQHFPKQDAAEATRILLQMMRNDLTEQCKQGKSNYCPDWSDKQVQEEHVRLMGGASSPAAPASASPSVRPPQSSKRQQHRATQQRGGGKKAHQRSAPSGGGGGGGGGTGQPPELFPPFASDADDADDYYCYTNTDESHGHFPYAADQCFLTYWVFLFVRAVSWSIEAHARAAARARAKDTGTASATAKLKGASSSTATTGSGVGAALAGIDNLFVSLPAESKKDMDQITTPLEGVGPIPKGKLPAFDLFLRPLNPAVLTLRRDASKANGKGNGHTKSKSRRSRASTLKLREANIVDFTREWIAQHPPGWWQQLHSQARPATKRKSAPPATPLKDAAARPSMGHSSRAPYASQSLRSRHSMAATAAASPSASASARSAARRSAASTSLGAASGDANFDIGGANDEERDYCELSSDEQEEEENEEEEEEEEALSQSDSSVEDAGDDGEFCVSPSRRAAAANGPGSSKLARPLCSRPVRKKARVDSSEVEQDEEEGGSGKADARQRTTKPTTPTHRAAAAGRIVAACPPPPTWLSFSRPADRAGPSEHKAAINPKRRTDSAASQPAEWESDDDDDLDAAMGVDSSPSPIPLVPTPEMPLDPTPNPTPTPSPSAHMSVSQQQQPSSSQLPLPVPISAPLRLMPCPSSASSGSGSVSDRPSSVHSNATTQESVNSSKASSESSLRPSLSAKELLAPPVVPLPFTRVPPLLPVITAAALHDALSQNNALLQSSKEKEDCAPQPFAAPSAASAAAEIQVDQACPAADRMDCDAKTSNPSPALIDLTQSSPSPPLPPCHQAASVRFASSSVGAIVPLATDHLAAANSRALTDPSPPTTLDARDEESPSLVVVAAAEIAVATAPAPAPAFVCAPPATHLTIVAGAGALVAPPTVTPVAVASPSSSHALRFDSGLITAKAEPTPSDGEGDEPESSPSPAPASQPPRAAVSAQLKGRELISIDDDDDDDADLNADGPGATVVAAAAAASATAAAGGVCAGADGDRDPAALRDLECASLRTRLAMHGPAFLLVDDLLHHPDMQGADRWLRIDLRFPAAGAASASAPVLPRCLLWHADPKQLESIFRDINILQRNTFKKSDIAAHAQTLHRMLHAHAQC